MEKTFLFQSLVVSGLCCVLTHNFTSAEGWQHWLIIVSAFIFCLSLAIQQANLIEYGIWLAIIIVTVYSLSTTGYFDFHWSLIVSGTFGAIQGMIGRYACD